MIVAFSITLLFHILWMLPCLSLLIFFVDRIARRAAPFGMHCLWALVLPLTLALSTLTALLHHADNGGALTNFAVGATAPISITDTSAIAELPLRISHTAAELILAAAAMCISAGLVRFAFLLITVRRIRHNAATQAISTQQYRQVERIVAHMSITMPEVLQSTEICSPILIGSRHPAIILPFGFSAQCSADEFTAAVAHECAHIQRKDYHCNLILRSLATLLFWHPCTLFVLRQLSISREVATDRLAAETVGNPRIYAQSLLHLWQRITQPPVQPQGIGIFDANVLEERIMQIVNYPPRLTRPRRIAIATTSLLVLTAGAYAANTLRVQVQSPILANAIPGNPDVVSRVKPIPPASFHKQPAGFTAKVVLGVLVQQDGKPQNIRVVTSGGRDYDVSAIDAVRQWHFRPGKPYKTNVTINFSKTQ